MPISTIPKTPAVPTPSRVPVASEDGVLFLQRYLDEFQRLCRGTGEWMPQLLMVRDLLRRVAQAGGKVIVVGNGGSAAIASHVAVDLTKTARIRAVNFNEADLITCFANDYGYTEWLRRAIEFYGEPGDALIAISSSGQSKNILKACRAAKRTRFAGIVTCSGFSPENPLRAMGDHNLWVDSRAYNLVETTHQFWLLALVDLLIGRTEYPAA